MPSRKVGVLYVGIPVIMKKKKKGKKNFITREESNWARRTEQGKYHKPEIFLS